MADVGEEDGLGAVQLGQFLGPPLLGLVTAGAGDPRRDVSRGQLDEPPVPLVQGPVPVERGHQEPVRRAALLQQRHHRRLHGRLRPVAGRQAGEPGAVERHEHRLPPGQRRRGPHPVRVAGREDGGGGRMPGGDPRRPGQPRAAVVVEQVGQREREVVPVAAELAAGEGEHLLLGADHAGIGAEIPQRRHPPLADDPLGVLADDAQHADHGAVVVAEGTVGERVVGLLRVAGPFQEQQQRLVPGRLPRGQHGADPRADVVPDLRPHLVGRPAQRPGVLLPQGVAAVGGVAEERQLRPPRHPHGEPGRQQDAHRGPQALRPPVRRPKRGLSPVHSRQVPADLLVGGEHRGSGRSG